MVLLNNMSRGFNYINNSLLEQFQKWACKIFQNADILISPTPLPPVRSCVHLADPPFPPLMRTSFMDGPLGIIGLFNFETFVKFQGKHPCWILLLAGLKITQKCLSHRYSSRDLNNCVLELPWIVTCWKIFENIAFCHFYLNNDVP